MDGLETASKFFIYIVTITLIVLICKMYSWHLQNKYHRTMTKLAEMKILEMYQNNYKEPPE